MYNSRKYASSLIDKIKQIQIRNEDLKQELLNLESEENYQKIENFYASALNKLTKKVHALPIRHRHTGTFYLKKAYTCPTEYEKLDGSVFMKEYLVSWTIENNEDYRYMYHSPSLESQMIIAI